uniref:Uncharacterized protein n=1 Tax=Vombatus ursinus TaxID=29139 RepID=A0A4X2L851_VOMUR
MMVLKSQLKKKMLSKYKYKDLIIWEIVIVITLHRDLKLILLGTYVFDDGNSRLLMSLTGTILVYHPYSPTLQTDPELVCSGK